MDACIRGNLVRTELQVEPKYRAMRTARLPILDCGPIRDGGEPEPLSLTTQRDVLNFWMRKGRLPVITDGRVR